MNSEYQPTLTDTEKSQVILSCLRTVWNKIEKQSTIRRLNNATGRALTATQWDVILDEMVSAAYNELTHNS